MELWSESARTVWPFPFPPQDWEQTPPAVQAYLRTVRHALDHLQERYWWRIRLSVHSSRLSQLQQGRTARACPRFIGKPAGDPGEIHRRRSQDMLDVSPSQTDIAGTT